MLEESAIRVSGPLEPVYEGLLPSGAGTGVTHWYVYAAATPARDEDIVVGEGADIVFVRPEDTVGLDLAPSAAQILPEFLGSPLHRALAAEAAGARSSAPLDAEGSESLR